MALVPLSYNLRSLLVRRSATLLTVLGIGATVAVVSGVLALQQGFERLFAESGREDLLVVLRKGATDEGGSVITRAQADTLVKSSTEIAVDPNGRPEASLESYLAVRRPKLDGGETNVPIRGVQQATFRIRGERLKIVEGRRFEMGADEVMVGRKLIGRIQDCGLGQVIVFNTTPFRVVGVFDYDGPFSSEIWGDVDRFAEALERKVYNRAILKLAPGVTVEQFSRHLEDDLQLPSDVLTERDFLMGQTRALSNMLLFLGGVLGLIMGIAAIFTATNTMLAALAARTHEIGILLSIGFRPITIFCSFLFEAILLCLLGGLVGCLITLPLHGIETGTINYQTFTEVAFAFQVTPRVLLVAISFSTLLGLLGGAWPAWRAARLAPTVALRRH